MGIVVHFAQRVLWIIPYFNVEVYMFGVWTAIACSVSWYLVDHDVTRKKMKVDPPICIGTIIICGFAMSKLAVFFLDSSSISVMESGMSFQGGVVGAVIGLSVYFYLVGQRFPAAYDTGATVLPIGHAIGKLGCFFSGDGCYGMKTGMPWGMSFPNGLRPTRSFVHPTPLYEATLSFLIFAFLWRRRKTMKHEMDNAFAMIILLSGSRVFIEYVRDHDPVWCGMSVYQLWALGGVGIGVGTRAISRALDLFGEPADVRGRRKLSKKQQ